MDIDKNIKLAAQEISKADAILINAGAGIGVDSGLPDFRGNSGFWKAYPPIAKLGKSFSEMANPIWFQDDPKIAWAFYGHRLNLYRKTIPHKGFHQLLEIGKSKIGDYFVFTSNVDGQFQKAGYNDELIEECHGSIHHFQCSVPCTGNIWAANDIEVKVNEKVFEAQAPFPECPTCGAVARPNILMFGDWAWLSDRTTNQANRLSEWLESIKNYRLAIIEMGAGKYVPSVRHKSQHIARNNNSILIRINPRDYDVPKGNISIPLGAAEGVKKIYELWSSTS